MKKVNEFLDLASKAYYDGSPIISDAVFDRLAETSGYSKVGAKQHEHIAKHFHRLYSLDKHYEDEGKKRPLSEYSSNDIVSSPKLDGAAVSHLYVGGELVQSLTRGDGIEGTIITDKFLETNLVPKEIEYKGILQVSGEIVAPIHVPNARNYAAGALNLKDINEFRTRAIEFFAYGVYMPANGNTGTYIQDMQALSTLGFHTILEENLHRIYPCDGIVFRLNSNKKFLEAGFTANFPKGAYALKERKEAVETKIISVDWQVGKSGKVTPVANLEPVMIGDKRVTRATLNNQAFIEALGICIGDTVGVVVAGEIIPCITHKVDA